jgi:hypothetical protein
LCCPFLYQTILFSLQHQDISLASSPFVCLSIFLFEWICKALCNGSFQKVLTRWGFVLHINVFNEIFLGIYWVTFCDRWRTRYIKLLRTSTLFWVNFEKFSNVKCDLFLGWFEITSPWAFQICCVCLCAIYEGITIFWTTSSTYNRFIISLYSSTNSKLDEFNKNKWMEKKLGDIGEMLLDWSMHLPKEVKENFQLLVKSFV